jgi:hypothetical protein
MRKEADEPIDLGPGRLGIAAEAGQLRQLIAEIRPQLGTADQGKLDRVQHFLGYVQTTAQTDPNAVPTPEPAGE